MPFKVFRDVAACSQSHPFAVYTVDDQGRKQGTPHGCFTTEQAAQQQQRALFARVPEARQ
jgi:hypothetical protein